LKDVPIRTESIQAGPTKTFLFGEKYTPQSHLGKKGIENGVEDLDHSLWNGNCTTDETRTGGSGFSLAATIDEPLPTRYRCFLVEVQRP